MESGIHLAKLGEIEVSSILPMTHIQLVRCGLPEEAPRRSTDAGRRLVQRFCWSVSSGGDHGSGERPAPDQTQNDGSRTVSRAVVTTALELERQSGSDPASSILVGCDSEQLS